MHNFFIFFTRKVSSQIFIFYFSKSVKYLYLSKLYLALRWITKISRYSMNSIHFLVALLFLTIACINAMDSRELHVNSYEPSTVPSGKPSVRQFANPSRNPTSFPSGYPSIHPTSHQTDFPSGNPTLLPSVRKFENPTRSPSSQPTGNNPTISPTQHNGCGCCCCCNCCNHQDPSHAPTPFGTARPTYGAMRPH